MPEQYPPELDDFVQAQLATGDYRTEGELLLDALWAFRELKLRHQVLLGDLRQAIAQADGGQLHPLDTEVTKAEARRRLPTKTPSG